jgi:GTP-binding protein Era
MAFRSGFVSIIGRPNAGKSTLLNALVGEKVAIVTHKPQTTRNRIQGVLEVASKKKEKGSPGHPPAQIVFVDTPGIHRPATHLDKRMMQDVYEALESRDIVLLMVDATRRLISEEDESVKGKRAQSLDEDAFVVELIGKLDCPVYLLLNKIDEVSPADLLPLIAHWSAKFNFTEVLPISARKRDGLEKLTAKIIERLPEGQRYFPRGQFTDQPERFLAAELVREKILMLTGEEVPHSSAVVIERFEEPAPNAKKPVIRIAAAIFCERTGQKAILIGKGGAMLKQIGTAARKELESLLGVQVFLELFVKVREEWRSSRGFVEELDWRRQLEDLAKKQAVINEDEDE